MSESNNKNKKREKEIFFSEHPYCCFCGGSTRTETEDHVPSRQFFSDRRWPDGYVFPACYKCNAATRKEEQSFYLLSCINHGPGSPQGSSKFGKLVQAVRNNDPGALKLHMPTTNEKRALFRELNISPQRGTVYSDYSIVKIDTPEAEQAINQTLKKILLALHYKHSGNILKKNQSAAALLLTNLTASPVVDQMIQLAGDPRMVRANLSTGKGRGHVNLNSQFNYMYMVEENEGQCFFIINIREVFVAFACTGADTNVLNDNIFAKCRIFAPFNHSE